MQSIFSRIFVQYSCKFLAFGKSDAMPTMAIGVCGSFWLILLDSVNLSDIVSFPWIRWIRFFSKLSKSSWSWANAMSSLELDID